MPMPRAVVITRKLWQAPFFSPTNFAPPSPQSNRQINMVYMHETRSLTNSKASFSNNSEFTHM